MLSALLIIVIAKIIIKPLRNPKMKMLFSLICLDFMLCMPLIRIFIDLIYHVNFLDQALALLVFFIYALFIYLTNLPVLKKLNKSLKKTDELIYNKITSPAIVSTSIILFFFNIVDLSIPPIISHSYSPYFEVLNLYFIEIPIPNGLLLYYLTGSAIGILFCFSIITYIQIKKD